jgi:hypothetical protein
MMIATNIMMMENIVYLRYKVATRLSVYPTTDGNGIGENPSFYFLLTAVSANRPQSAML